MAIDSKIIRIRRGTAADFNVGKTKLVQGEFAVVTDTKEAYFAAENGEAVRLATEKDVSQLQEQKVDHPSTGQVGQILEIESVDENGKPKSYKAVDKPIGGEITDEQVESAVRDYLEENPIDGNTVETFTTQPIGRLFERPVDYSAWCSQSLQYDSNLGKYVDLIHGTPTHMSATSERTLWVTYIDPKTYEAEEPVECKYVDVNGNELTPTNKGRSAYLILDDGSYLLFNHMNGTMYRFISNDNGKTWVQEKACTGYPTTNEMYFLVKLSNGRLLANSSQMKSIARSDDMGLTWKTTTPTTSGGNLEAEIFMSEVKEGVVIAIGRYSMSGIGYDASGDSQHAIISYSYDYGDTWTPWKISDTLDNMNASSCTGYCHDGMIEIFTGSRWYYNGSYSNTDYDNTGKTGAITHYVATIENALNDNFTKIGVVVYAKAKGDGSSQDFHTPCIAVNGKDMLLCYFDRVEPYTEESANHYFVRGHMGSSIDYGVRDDLISAVFPYSSAKVDELLKRQYAKLMEKINEIVINGGGTPDTGDDPENDPENPSFYITDGIIFNYNMLDSAKYDVEKVTITDSIKGQVATFVKPDSTNFTAVNELPTIRDNSVSLSAIYLPENTLSKYITSENYEMSIEMGYYRYADDVKQGTGDYILCSNGSGGSSFRHGMYDVSGIRYVNTSGNYVKIAGKGGKSVINIYATDVFQHGVLTMGSDGTAKFYKNGELLATVTLDDFTKWDDTLLTRAFKMGGYCKSIRLYGKVLSESEIINNYNYEKAGIVY